MRQILLFSSLKGTRFPSLIEVLDTHVESQVRLPLSAQHEVEFGLEVSARKAKYNGRVSLLLQNVRSRK
jgi:hypothetical protein